MTDKTIVERAVDMIRREFPSDSSMGWSKRGDGWSRLDSGYAFRFDRAAEDELRKYVEEMIVSGSLGAHLKDAVAEIGVRAAFPTLFGFPIVWDAEKFELARTLK